MGEDAVFDNETSGDKLLRSERMVYTNEAVPDSRLQEIKRKLKKTIKERIETCIRK